MCCKRTSGSKKFHQTKISKVCTTSWPRTGLTVACLSEPHSWLRKGGTRIAHWLARLEKPDCPTGTAPFLLEPAWSARALLSYGSFRNFQFY
jgi:hypothetical protein